MFLSTLIQKLSGPFGRRVFRPLMRDRSSVFMLHRLDNRTRGVHGHSPEFVGSALAALRNSGAVFVPLRTMVESWATGRAVDPNWVAFTIDDGFADQAQLVESAFIPIKCPVTVFLITGFLDGKLWPWDDQLAYAFRQTPLARVSLSLAGTRYELDLSTVERKYAALNRIREACKTMSNAGLYGQIGAIAAALQVPLPTDPPEAFKPMSWDKARELERNGVDFAPHSVTHRIFSQLTTDEVRTEMANSWARLRTELRNPAPIFAWPTGRYTDFSSKDIEIARELGMLASVATDDNYAHLGSHDPIGIYRIKRFSLPYDVTTVLRYGSWVERARQLMAV